MEFLLTFEPYFEGMINSIYRGVCVLGCCFLDSEIWSFCLLLSNFRDFINFIWDFGVSN